MTSFKRLLSLLFILNLFGCVKADQHSSDTYAEEFDSFSRYDSLVEFNNRTMFEAGNIIVYDHRFSDHDEGNWREVDHLQLWFRLCGLRDRASRGTLRNERFNIRSELGGDIEWAQRGEDTQISNPVVVNSDNCLEWSQSIPYFDYFAPSNNLVLHYEIESLSGNLGKMVKRIYVNPWDMQRQGSQFSGILDITNLSSRDWGSGHFVVGEENISAALRGDYRVANEQHRVRLQMDSINVSPEMMEREAQELADFNARLERMSPEDRRAEEERFEAHRRREGLHVRMNFTGQPFVQVGDATGVVHRRDITTGRFDVYMTLLATGATNDARYFRLAEDVRLDTPANSANYFDMTINTNRLQASVPMSLLYDSNFGRVRLAIKVVPRDVRGVEPFMASLDLGEHNAWFRSQTPQFSRRGYQAEDDVSYNALVNNATPLFITRDRQVIIPRLDENGVMMRGRVDENGQFVRDDNGDYIMDEEGEVIPGEFGLPSTVRTAELFRFSPLVIRFVRVMPGETATDRTLQYSVKTCVEHGATGANAEAGLQFEITTYDREDPDNEKGRPFQMRRATNEDGCLIWFGYLSHKYYHKEVLQRKVADVRFVGAYTQEGEFKEDTEWTQFIDKFEQEFVYYMNPWDEKFTFGWDSIDMPRGYVEEVERQKEEAPDSKLFLADFKYETMGFRYEIDKYMNLKVKKAVLFKAYPYVLKYNSIVLGRNGTEKLRDGVYLMKVALQKDYVDPAANGVRIYNTDGNGNETGPIEEGEQAASYPQIQIPDNDPLCPVEGRCKQYISIQQKLVRVIGGIIVTPIEFEVEDLRLMRIRNQFYIQLQTIDEHKLRFATMADRALNNLADEAQVQARYEQILNAFNTLEELDERGQISLLLQHMHGNPSELSEAELNDVNILRTMDEQIDYLNLTEYLQNINTLEETRDEAERIIQQALGFDNFDPESPEFQERRQFIADQLARIEAFRQLGAHLEDRYAQFSAQNIFRNRNRELIDGMLEHFETRTRDLLDQDWVSGRDDEYIESTRRDPFLRYFYLGSSGDYNTTAQRIFDYEIGRLMQQNGSRSEELRTLRSADFTESSLAPNYDFELLRNDGTEEHQSGLPARTFVGPLTFVHNTNGSSLRPTDILGEQDCNSNFTCSTMNRLEAAFSPIHQPPISPMTTLEHPSPQAENAEPLPPIDFPRVMGLSEGRIVNNPIYDSSDSANFENETNPYYGSLRDYAYRTFESDADSPRSRGLTCDKQRLETEYIIEMETRSQILNFVETIGLKHILLNDHPEDRSLLKRVDRENCINRLRAQDQAHFERTGRCERTWTEEELRGQCFVNVDNSPYSMEQDELYSLLNERSGEQGRQFTVQTGRASRRAENLMFYHDSYGNADNHITEQDLTQVIRWGVNKRQGELTDREVQTEMSKPEDERIWPIEDNKKRMLYHRMCYALSQKFFNQNYFDKDKRSMAWSFLSQRAQNQLVIEQLENFCHKVTQAYFENRGTNFHGIETDRFSPIVFERKLRIINTSGRYVYRGGKSLNVNISTGFGLSRSRGFSVSHSVRFNPLKVLERIPIMDTIVGTLGFSSSATNSTNISSSDGTSVSSGTFLVSQEAALVVELSQYERCVVARLNPKVFTEFKRLSKRADFNPFSASMSNVLKRDFNYETDVDASGFMLCEGKTSTEPIPVNETFYYFTQHFTEGDMLDMADIHNHPWLFQLRGYRDFQTFMSLIGAQEVDYVDRNIVMNAMERVTTDLQAMNNAGNRAQTPHMQVVAPDTGTRWPLEHLGSVYAKMLPTFPSLYTFVDERDNVPDWPYDNNDPGEALPPESEASDQ